MQQEPDICEPEVCFGQQAWSGLLMECISIPELAGWSRGAARQAAELTKNASRQRTATRLESERFMLYLLRRICEQTVTPQIQFSA